MSAKTHFDSCDEYRKIVKSWLEQKSEYDWYGLDEYYDINYLKFYIWEGPFDFLRKKIVQRKFYLIYVSKFTKFNTYLIWQKRFI